MSRSRKYDITCPACGTRQEVELYESINVASDPNLKTVLMQNRLNRVDCSDCDHEFRVDMPLLYSDPAHAILIYWVPETAKSDRSDIIEEFDRMLEDIADLLTGGEGAPKVRLVFTRVELVELIFMVEANMNQRVVEYIKYNIYTRNDGVLDPHKYRLLLNVEDSTDEELLFVMQEVESQEFGRILRYGRAAYRSLCALYDETPEEFIEMFPGPCISARNLLLDEVGET